MKRKGGLTGGDGAEFDDVEAMLRVPNMNYWPSRISFEPDCGAQIHARVVDAGVRVICG